MNNLTNKRCIAFLRILVLKSVFFPIALFANPFSDGVLPESASCRAKLVDNWFVNDINEVQSYSSLLLKNEINEEFLVRTETQGIETKIIVSPCVQMQAEIITGKAKQLVLYDTWPADSSGAWILYRNIQNGLPVRIRLFFQENPEIYLQITPYAERSRVDLVVFGTHVAQKIILGVPFENFYAMSLVDLYFLTEKLLPWKYVIVPYGMYDDTIQMVAHIRNKLPAIVYKKDAAYNDLGQAVCISTGEARDNQDKNLIVADSLGFLKWIADGLIKPLTGSFCYIDSLFTETQTPIAGSLASVALKEKDIYKSLNWTRNLAVAVLSARTRDASLRFANSGVGVTTLEMPKCPYVAKSGYPVDCLPALLFVLAVTEPDLFFFGAICERVPLEKELHHYEQAVVIFPYFTADNRFHVVVFENGAEYTLSQFLEKYKNTFIQLVRVTSSSNFLPLDNVAE